MNTKLQYSLEEVHEMHKRIVLDGVFSLQHDGHTVVEAGEVSAILDTADRLLNALMDRGFVKEE